MAFSDFKLLRFLVDGNNQIYIYLGLLLGVLMKLCVVAVLESLILIEQFYGLHGQI